MLIGLIAATAMTVITLRMFGYDLPNLLGMVPAGTFGPLFNRDIAIISGHAGYDSGAICTDAMGNTTIKEVDINARIAEMLMRRLQRNGATVMLLDEFDARLAGLQVDLLLSLHADSCIEASGYKSARATNAAVVVETDKLSRCIDQSYADITNLIWHPNTITHDMTDYHAFRSIAPTTPALILEMGFIGGDQALLTERPARVARGIAESLVCFFDDTPNPE